MLTGPKFVTSGKWEEYAAKRIPALREQGHGFCDAQRIAGVEYRRSKRRKANPYRFKMAGKDEDGRGEYVVVELRGGDVVPVGTYECDGVEWVYEGLDGRVWSCLARVHANRAKTRLIRYLLGLEVY